MFLRPQNLFSQFKSQRAKLIFSWNSTCGHSVLHGRNFLLPNSCSAVHEASRNHFWGISIFWEKSDLQTDSYFLRGLSDDIFSKQTGSILKNLLCQSFSCLSALQKKWVQKAKRGKPKIEKVCWEVGRLLTPNRYFSVSHLELIAKQRCRTRFRSSRSKIDHQKWQMTL